MADDILDKIDQMTKESSFTGERIDVAGKLTKGIIPSLKKTAKETIKKAIPEPVQKFSKEVMEAPAFRSPVLQTLEQRKYQKPIIPKNGKVEESPMSNEQTNAAIDDANASESINDTTIPADEPLPANVIVEELPLDSATKDAVSAPQDNIDDAAKQLEAPVAKEQQAPVEQLQTKTFKNVDEISGISIGPGGMIKPVMIEEGNSLYRETNVDGLNSLLWIDGRFEYNPMFVSNSKDLAIGQGENKGIKITFRPNSLSGKENIKPGTAGELGDIVGKEYKTDIIAPEAIQEITIDSEAKLKGINRTSKNILNTRFDKIQNEDGSISFVRKQKQPELPKENIEAKMSQEPIVTPEQLGAGIKKAEQEISDILATGKAEKLLPPSQIFNLASQGDLAPALKAISELSGIETKKVNFSNLTKEFQDRGFPSDFIDRLTSGKLDVSPEVSLQILNAEKWSSSVLDDIGRRVLRGEATDAEMYDSVKAISFNSLLLRSIKGYKTNLAQSFAALGIKVEPGTLFETGIDGIKTKDDLLSFFSKREEIKASNDLTEPQKAKVLMEMNDAVATGTWLDRGITSYLSGLISGFGTLARVIGGDAPRLALRPANTLGASFYGALRNTDLLGGKLNVGSANRRYANEALAQITSIDKGIENGLQAAVFAWKEGYSALDASGSSRMGVKAKPDFLDIDPDTTPIAQAVMKGFNWMSAYGTRSVMTASEFMKGVHYQMGMDALATRKGIEARELARSFNKTEDEQWDAYQQAARDVYVNPPEDVLKEAKYWTLESRPEKGSFSEWVMNKVDVKNIPNPGISSALDRFVRLKFPFMFTTTNDMIQSLEHTPLNAAWMGLKGISSGVVTFAQGSDKIFDFSNRMKAVAKKVREDINSGDYVQRDMALAKITTGTGIISYFVNLAADGKITGAGPRDKAEREKWMAQGARPFSFVLEDTEGLSDSERLAIAEANYGTAYKYSLGSGEYAGKIYVSYNGMSTFAALAGIGATLNESSQYLDSDDYIGMAHAGILGMGDYIMDYQMLTGVSSMIKGYQDIKANAESGLKRSFNESTKWLVNVIGGMAIPASAQRRYWSKQLDDTQVDFPIDPDMPAGVSGFMSGWNEQMRGLFQNTGSNRITMFGDDIKYDDPNAILSTSFGKGEKAQQIRILSGAQTRKPSKSFSGEDEIYIGDEVRKVEFNVPMSDEEYKTMIILANAPEEDGGYNLKNKLIELEYDNNFINGSADDRKNHVESIISSAFKGARDDIYFNPENKFYGSDKLQQNVNAAHKTLKKRVDEKLQEIKKPMMKR